MSPRASASSDPIRLTLAQARRIAVRAQLLDGSASSIHDTILHVGNLQLDPTNRVARSHLLVLWSRLGSYDPAELERLLWRDRSLFEWQAFIYPTEHLAAIRSRMERFRRQQADSPDQVVHWLKVNEAFRRYILEQLLQRGPLLSRDLEDRAVQPWASTGWTGNRNVSQMLHFLAARGEIAIVGRSGAQRKWDLAERWFPETETLSNENADRWVVRQRLKARGIALRSVVEQPHVVTYTRLKLTCPDIVRSRLAIPVAIEGIAGDWVVDPDVLVGMDTPLPARTTLLSPFDALIHDRGRTEALFDFSYRLEMYVPKEQRQYGYFVLPVLYGDRLIGRLDPELDRKQRVLHVHSVHVERDAPDNSRRLIEGAVTEMADWLGARDVAFS